jgi:hypothetical protein
MIKRDTKSVSFNTDKAVHRKFKTMCMINDMDMGKTLTELMEKYVKGSEDWIMEQPKEYTVGHEECECSWTATLEELLHTSCEGCGKPFIEEENEFNIELWR